MVAEFKDILVLSDTQVGSVWGLWPSEYDMTDGTRRSQNKGQQYLWKTWLHLSHWLAEAQRRGDAHIVSAVLNGDLIDGKQRLQEALESMTPNLVDQGRAFRICLDAFLAPLTPRPTLYSVQGCLTEGHRVLTADLRWRPVEDLAVGDRLLTVEKYPAQSGRGYTRHWMVAPVTAHVQVQKDVCEVRLADGRILSATENHPFLVRGCRQIVWRRASELKSGDELVEAVRPWQMLDTYAAGWVGGLLAGEGTIQKKGSVEFAQKDIPTLTKTLGFLEDLGAQYSVYPIRREPFLHQVHITGGAIASWWLIGQTRPDRLIAQAMRKLGSMKSRRGVKVTEVRFKGTREVVGLSTASGTYISDGFISRNTEYHDQKSGTAVESLAEAIGAIPFESVGIGEYSGELLDLNVDGVVLNFLHGISATAGLYRAVAIDREALWSAIAGKEGKVPKADVIVRSHVHHFVHVEHESKHALITPCWQLQTRFMRRVSAYRMMPDIGAVVIRVWKEAIFGGDRVSIYKFLFPLPARKAVALTIPDDASAEI